MGSPAAVLGDQVQATCTVHLIPNPASGAPQPSPPLPFSAPLTMATVASVMIENKPAAVVGCSGLNSPPHVGLHPSDPYMAPPAQLAEVVAGSTSVLIGGQPAATAASQCTVCAGLPGVLLATAASVLIG